MFRCSVFLLSVLCFYTLPSFADDDQNQESYLSHLISNIQAFRTTGKVPLLFAFRKVNPPFVQTLTVEKKKGFLVSNKEGALSFASLSEDVSSTLKDAAKTQKFVLFGIETAQGTFLSVHVRVDSELNVVKVDFGILDKEAVKARKGILLASEELKKETLAATVEWVSDFFIDYPSEYRRVFRRLMRNTELKKQERVGQLSSIARAAKFDLWVADGIEDEGLKREVKIQTNTFRSMEKIK